MDLNHTDLQAAMGGGMSWDLVPTAGENAYTPFCNDTHGTAVGGVIGAAHNGAGSVGIAPGITLSVVRIFRNRVNCPGQPFIPQVASDLQIGDGINWAWQYAQADVMSNSWGGGAPSNAITTAISNAITQGRGGKGTVVVFAAGNTSARSIGIIGNVSYPGNLNTVFTVGAINRHGNPADYTPDGAAMDIVAPSGHLTGTCIGEVVTTDRVGSFGCNDGPTGDVNYTQTFSGTSAAAPQVAAVAALLLSLEPNLTVNQVRNRLTGAADPWGAAITFGAGKLNAYKTLYVPPPITVSIAGKSSVRPHVTCLWTAAPTSGVAPYTYAWTINGNPVSNGSSDPAELVYQNSGVSFTIGVVVHDAVSGTGSASKNVTISGSPQPCVF